MPKKKLRPSLKKLVLRERKRVPDLGVRGLATYIAEKHNIKLSKSTIHKILKTSGFKQKPGRKQSFLLYKARGVEPCGLILLRALDSHIGLFDYIAKGLKIYFPQLSYDFLKKLIILNSFSSFIGKNPKESLQRPGFLRVVGFYHLPQRKLNYFNRIISQHKPVLNLTKLKQDLKPTAAIKFYFKNGYRGFTDARMSTFWDGPSKIEHLFSPLRVARLNIQKMLGEKILIVGYTKSFNYLSPLVFNFLNGIKSGLAKVEFLGSRSEVLDEIKVLPLRIPLVFGYSPQILRPEVSSSSKSLRFRRFFCPELGEFFLSTAQANFQFSKQGLEINLDNILLKKEKSSSASWGLLSNLRLDNRRPLVADFLRKYLYLWPYVWEDFFKEMEIIEKSFFSAVPAQPDLTKMLPSKLYFARPVDFVRVGQILSALFKELVWPWEPKAKKGSFSLYKNYIKVVFRQVPPGLKKALNKACFYIDKRKIFLE